MRKLIVGLVAGAILTAGAVGVAQPLPSAAAARPTTTTSPPPPPVQALGVPHVVAVVVPFTGTSGVQQDVSCPTGEAALSAAVQHYDNAGNRMFISSDDAEAEPIVDGADRPVGYHFMVTFGQGSVHLDVTCAPIVSA